MSFKLTTFLCHCIHESSNEGEYLPAQTELLEALDVAGCSPAWPTTRDCITARYKDALHDVSETLLFLID